MTNQQTYEPSVWFVDDNKPYLDSCVDIYKKLYNYDVRTARNVKEAIALARYQSGPTVLFIDFHLGDEIDGTMLLAKMQEICCYPLVPYFVSADSSVDAYIKAFEAGGDGYHVKPVDPRVLKACVDHVARRQLKQLELAGWATRDPLTGLYNRLGFLELCLQGLAQARRNNTPTSCLYLDLDDFKKINDTLGHEVGDDMIREVAKAIKYEHVTRTTDIVGRRGGDEFVVLLLKTSSEKAPEIARRIEKAISSIRLYDRRGERMHLAASIGIASIDADMIGNDLAGALESLIARGDKALLKIKKIKKQEKVRN